MNQNAKNLIKKFYSFSNIVITIIIKYIITKIKILTNKNKLD
jgi:hypothetical protein